MPESRPSLPEAVRRWVYRHALDNFWRLEAAGLRHYEQDDLIQDGLDCAYKCLARYGDVDPPHLMSLVQRTFYRHIGALLRPARAMPRQAVTETQSLDSLMQKSGYTDRMDEFGLLIAELPEYLRTAVVALFRNPEQFRVLRARLDGDDETLSERLHAVCGFDKSLNFEVELRAWLWLRDNLC